MLPANAPRDVWLAERRKLICSSDIANIFGVGWSDAYTVWIDKTGRMPDEPPTIYQARGIDLEAAVIDHWVKRHATDGLRVRRAGLMRSTRYRRAGATVDRMSTCRAGRCIVEAKTQANTGEWGTVEDPQVPTGFQFQGQWQLGVTGRQHLHYIVMGPRFWPFERIMIRDEELIETMFCAAARFWGRYVITDRPPAAGRKDADTLRRLWPEPGRGSAYVLDEDDCNTMHLLANWRRTQTDTNRTVDDLIARLQAKIGAATEVYWPDGHLAATWRPSKTVDGASNAWRAAHPELVDHYGIPVTGILLDYTKMVADLGGLPDGLRYRRTFLPKSTETEQT